MTKAKAKIKDIFDEVIMYLFTAAGVMLSKYMPIVKAIILEGVKNNDVKMLLPYKAEMIAAAVIAIVVTYLLEKDGDKEGKRKNFKRRAFAHIANGALWNTIIGS